MLFNYKYSGSSAVNSSADKTGMNFSPDALREPTFFRGTLRKNIPFREAISALHYVVVSDLRFKPKDREEYKAWAAQQEQIYLEEMAATNEELKAKVGVRRKELDDLYKQSSKVMGPYYKAQKKILRLYLSKRSGRLVCFRSSNYGTPRRGLLRMF